MVVVAFPNERADKPFWPLFDGKPVRVAGFFRRRADADYITLNTEYGEGVYRMTFPRVHPLDDDQPAGLGTRVARRGARGVLQHEAAPGTGCRPDRRMLCGGANT
jgi:hypothetical protein